MYKRPSARSVRRAVVLFGASAAALVSAAASEAGSLATDASAAGDTIVISDSAARIASSLAGLDLRFLDSLLGRSKKLRARFVPTTEASESALLIRLFGDSAFRAPGIYSLQGRQVDGSFALISKRPFNHKVAGRIGGYRIGFWPFEGRSARSEQYESPDGFIEVTPANQDTRISEHFQLRDFLTKDQHAVWPKYLVLNERLIDKLELVIDELQAEGIRVTHLSVMSGFRTPRYNAQGVGKGGRAATSRHQYGDAADVFVDNNRDGIMDDINRDGRVNTRDAAVLLRAVERVELAHPQLIGGVGVYPATRSHGPFAHIDARGHRARWGEG
ncbi:MAG: hypothetical protein H7Z74_16535 [Anaerolineae bacterium]|nr:hypothetical protein [Gemmatimonadaceae bacterium]